MLASPGVMRMGRVTGVRVPMRMSSTWGMSATLFRMRSRGPSPMASGSPPVTRTSLMAGCLLIHSTALSRSARDAMAPGAMARSISQLRWQ